MHSSSKSAEFQPGISCTRGSQIQRILTAERVSNLDISNKGICTRVFVHHFYQVFHAWNLVGDANFEQSLFEFWVFFVLNNLGGINDFVVSVDLEVRVGLGFEDTAFFWKVGQFDGAVGVRHSSK